MIMTAGKGIASGLINNVGSYNAFTYLGYGTDATAESASQTDLIVPTARHAATATQTTTTTTNDTTTLSYSFTIGSTLTIQEVGAFNASSSGTMLARKVLTTPRSVQSGDTYTLSYSIALS